MLDENTKIVGSCTVATVKEFNLISDKFYNY